MSRINLRFALILAAGIALVTPVPAKAQNWTPEQQEVIDLNQACWDAWGTKDVAEMRRVCNEHPEATSWYTPSGAPTVGWFENNGDRWVDAFMSRSEWVYLEVIPLAVSIFDNTAQIYFWATLTEEDNDGVLTTHSRKQVNIWQKMDGRWTWIGGMMAIEDDDA